MSKTPRIRCEPCAGRGWHWKPGSRRTAKMICRICGGSGRTGP